MENLQGLTKTGLLKAIARIFHCVERNNFFLEGVDIEHFTSEEDECGKTELYLDKMHEIYGNEDVDEVGVQILKALSGKYRHTKAYVSLAKNVHEEDAIVITCAADNPSGELYIKMWHCLSDIPVIRIHD